MGWIDRAKYGVALLSLSGATLVRAQAPEPSDSKPVPATSAEQVDAPVAPTPHAAVANPFPKIDPKNFTADSPTVAVVNDFLTAVWGANRLRAEAVCGAAEDAAGAVGRAG